MWRAESLVSYSLWTRITSGDSRSVGSSAERPRVRTLWSLCRVKGTLRNGTSCFKGHEVNLFKTFQSSTPFSIILLQLLLNSQLRALASCPVSLLGNFPSWIEKLKFLTSLVVMTFNDTQAMKGLIISDHRDISCEAADKEFRSMDSISIKMTSLSYLYRKQHINFN